jgi:hypothetical protein
MDLSVLFLLTVESYVESYKDAAFAERKSVTRV